MSYSIAGVEDVQRMLDVIAPREARNLMRSTVHGMAGEIAKGGRKNAPRDKGDLKKAIKTKRKKSHPDKPVSDVVVTTGKQAKVDAFYWRFVEYGTVYQAENPFIRPEVDQVRANFEAILVAQFGKKLEKRLARLAKMKAGK